MGLFRKTPQEQEAKRRKQEAKRKKKEAKRERLLGEADEILRKEDERERRERRRETEFYGDEEPPAVSREERRRHQERLQPQFEKRVEEQKAKGHVVPRRRLKPEGKVSEVRLVGTSSFQTNIDLITSRIGDEGFSLYYTGKLSPYSYNPQDPEAVGVDVKNLRVGHLPSDVGESYRALVEEALELDRSVVLDVVISAAPPHVAETPNAGAVVSLPTTEAIDAELQVLRK